LEKGAGRRTPYGHIPSQKALHNILKTDGQTDRDASNKMQNMQR